MHGNVKVFRWPCHLVEGIILNWEYIFEIRLKRKQQHKNTERKIKEYYQSNFDFRDGILKNSCF